MYLNVTKNFLKKYNHPKNKIIFNMEEIILFVRKIKLVYKTDIIYNIGG